MQRQKQFCTAGKAFFLILLVLGFAGPLRADTPPSDLTELSLKEILELSIKRQSAIPAEKPDGFWSDRLTIGYKYNRIQFEDYLDGDTEKTIAEIQAQFNVVPTKITQEAHAVEFTYEASKNIYFNFSIPYIRQSTEHVSNVVGFADFTIRTEGIGDVSFLVSRLFNVKKKHNFMLHGGMSFPTGSIDETGDTPTAGPNNQLPYTMQLGSGTYDLVVGGSYIGGSGQYNYGADVMTTFRLGRNKRDYSLGDRCLVSTWLSMRPLEWLEPSIKFQYYHWGAISGVDNDLPAPGLVPVATPAFFGGEKVNSLLGLKFIATEGKLEGQSLNIEAGVPIFQYLNGPHPKETWRMSARWIWNF